MNAKPYFLFAVILLMLLTTSFSVYLYTKIPHVAFVNSVTLVENYKGTIEARRSFDKTKKALTANVDSLELSFERNRVEYIKNASRMTADARGLEETRLTQMQNQLIQYSQVIAQKIKEEDEVMMQEVLNQINSYVEEYARLKGYDVVLGTTTSGSLMYGEAALDITEPLLSGLNDRYTGK